MTPKEKAEEIFEKYIDIQTKIEWTDNEVFLKTCEVLNMVISSDAEKYWHELAKQSALIAVDTVQNLCWENNQVGIEHWEQVKQEIHNL